MASFRRTIVEVLGYRWVKVMSKAVLVKVLGWGWGALAEAGCGWLKATGTVKAMGCGWLKATGIVVLVKAMERV